MKEKNTLEQDPVIKSKKEIAVVVKERLQEKEWSIRQLAKEVELHHPQILRVTGEKNYNIETLIKILDGLDLELIIKKNEKR